MSGSVCHGVNTRHVRDCQLRMRTSLLLLLKRCTWFYSFCVRFISFIFCVYSEVMEWSKANTVKLIQLYGQHTVLWDIASADHKNSNNRFDALHAIAQAIDCDTATVERKITNVRSQYFRELAKVKKSKSGSSSNDVYKPSWYGFNMLSFLSPAVEATYHTSSLGITSGSNMVSVIT